LLALAALLLAAAAVCLVWMTMLVSFFAGAADLLGRSEAIVWGNIFGTFAVVALLGVVAPIAFISFAWRRAFPRRGVELNHEDL